MKTILKNYSFNTSAKTITLTDIATVRLDRLALITDVTTGKILYNFADNTVSTASVSTNVITLSVLQGGENNTDKLRIDYDVDTADTAFGDSTNATKVVSSALPTGAAQDSTLTGGSQKTKLVDSGGTNVASVSAAGALKVDNSGVTQPVSGTVTANVGTTNGLALDATLTGGSQQAKITDGTNSANILKSDGTAAGQNSLMVAGGYKESSGLSAGSLNADLVPSTDVSGYKWLSLQINGTWSGTLTFQASNDNSNWVSINLTMPNSGSSFGSTVTGNTLVDGPIKFRYFRVRMTSYTSGTATGVLELYTAPAAQLINTLGQGGTWTVQPGNTANTTPWLTTNTPATSGGFSTYHLVSAATTNATNIKASAGQVYGWYIYNSNASARKVAFHNASGTPTAGASVFFSLVIPPTSGANVFSDTGIPFSSGIAITTVTGLADSDATAVAANDLVINIFYK